MVKEGIIGNKKYYIYFGYPSLKYVGFKLIPQIFVNYINKLKNGDGANWDGNYKDGFLFVTHDFYMSIDFLFFQLNVDIDTFDKSKGKRTADEVLRLK